MVVDANKYLVQEPHGELRWRAVRMKLNMDNAFCLCHLLSPRLKAQRTYQYSAFSACINDSIRKTAKLLLILFRGGVPAALDNYKRFGSARYSLCVDGSVSPRAQARERLFALHARQAEVIGKRVKQVGGDFFVGLRISHTVS